MTSAESHSGITVRPSWRSVSVTVVGERLPNLRLRRNPSYTKKITDLHVLKPPRKFTPSLNRLGRELHSASSSICADLGKRQGGRKRGAWLQTLNPLRDISRGAYSTLPEHQIIWGRDEAGNAMFRSVLDK